MDSKAALIRFEVAMTNQVALGGADPAVAPSMWTWTRCREISAQFLRLMTVSGDIVLARTAG